MPELVFRQKANKLNPRPSKAVYSRRKKDMRLRDWSILTLLPCISIAGFLLGWYDWGGLIGVLAAIFAGAIGGAAYKKFIAKNK